MLFAWMFLLLAIMTEVAGTSSINKIIENGSLASYLPMWLGISVSYFFLSKAIKCIPIGIAYALWEGVGVTLITLVSVFYFGYDLSLQEMVGLGLAVTGIVMVNAGESHPEQAEEGA
ncbi:MAG: SMR family transporter [Plesiomonas shigelloides]